MFVASVFLRSAVVSAVLLLSGVSGDSSKWDESINPACCAYPEHDPRDYNWPYSHFQYSEVIPDVMGAYVSMTDLNMTYGTAEVEYGKELRPDQVVQKPTVSFDLEPDRSPSTLHTLMVVDPDVPFRDTPTDGEYVHWLVYDIPGNTVSAGKTLVEYQPPSPAKCPASDNLCLDEHRVTFVLWEQPHGPLVLDEEDKQISATDKAQRKGYKARDFATRHRLGLHIGMNFFETQAAGNSPLHVDQYTTLASEQPTARLGGRKDEL